MTTWHIHIKGMVQGVGFRPYVFRLANAMGIQGTVNNSSDGVHIMGTAEEAELKSFYEKITTQPPTHAIITKHSAVAIPAQSFSSFSIIDSEEKSVTDLMITPDLGLCEDCRKELMDATNRRFEYPFITCLHCGPRYSIIQKLPYDRQYTSMHDFEQCDTCNDEFFDTENRRHFSQTNSCDTCGIHLKLQHHTGIVVAEKTSAIQEKINTVLKEGKIIAVKGIGGFLLMCDAANEESIRTLRTRKNRPAKPLALLYPSLAMLETDTELCDAERKMLQHSKSPIVLCRLKKTTQQPLPMHVLAPGLNRIGAMLPYAPLLQLIANAFAKPLVATSGNISGSPIIFTNEEALVHLSHIADYLLLHDRDIVTPQDDSVMQLSKQHTIPIMLRRSRGWAPGYHPCNLPAGKKSLLAIGAELKGSFAISHQQKCFISQYLGDQGFYDAQQSYRQTLDHLSSLLQFQPDSILIDSHPAYEVSKYGKALAQQKNIAVTTVQHHEAHIAAVLAENNLLETNEPVLGIAWDGTGYGHDGQIWGGEFIRYQKGHFERIAHLAYFPMIMGDKMSREPRLSALALAHHLPEAKNMLRQKFNKNEWTLYNAMLHMPAAVLSTSSMGRLLDGIASLLGIADTSNYEGEAAMLLQAVAEQGNILESTIYPMPLVDGIIHWQPMIAAIVEDVSQQKAISTIALKVHLSLAHMIVEVANHFATPAIACSGGVMQNALLMDALKSHIQPHQTLYVHQQLSPNDECIAYGQLAWYHAQQISAQKKATAYSHFTSEKETYSTIDK